MPAIKGQILSDSTYMRYLVKFIEAESRMVVARGCGEGRMWWFIGYKVSVWENEKNSGDWLHNNVSVLYWTVQ